MAESTEFQALNRAEHGANVMLAGILPAVDDRYIDRLARHIAIRTTRGNAPHVLTTSGHTRGGPVSILTQSMSRAYFDDLDELAAAYADAWTAATAARRGRLRNDLICRCLPLAGRMARRYAGRGEPLDDLQQNARIGLINAVDPPEG